MVAQAVQKQMALESIDYQDLGSRYRVLQAIADDKWQNIFDALLDNPEVRKLRIILLQDLFMDDKK